MTDVCVLLMTAPSAEVAESIVNSLVAEKLIACGNITMPIASIYRWQGKTERASEVLVIMKSTAGAVGAVSRRVSELHPYEVPELLALPILGGHEPYLEWVRASGEGSTHD